MGREETTTSELIAILDKVFLEKTRDEWADLFQGQGKQFVAWERVQSIPDLLTDPQVLANGYITEFDHPVLGRIKMQPFPLSFSNAGAGPRTPAPRVRPAHGGGPH